MEFTSKFYSQKESLETKEIISETKIVSKYSLKRTELISEPRIVSQNQRKNVGALNRAGHQS